MYIVDKLVQQSDFFVRFPNYQHDLFPSPKPRPSPTTRTNFALLCTRLRKHICLQKLIPI
jgi:hypothetical protein